MQTGLDGLTEGRSCGYGGGEGCEGSPHRKICDGLRAALHVRHHVVPCPRGLCQDWPSGLYLSKKSAFDLFVAFLISTHGWCNFWRLVPLSRHLVAQRYFQCS